MWGLLFVVFVVFLALSFYYSKAMLWVVGAFVIIIVGAQYHTYQVRKDKSQIEVQVYSDPEECSGMAFSIKNDSTYTINGYVFVPYLRHEGFSSNLIKGYFEYTSDKIIKPNGTYSICYEMPRLKEAVEPSEIVWAYDRVEIQFDDSRSYHMSRDKD